MKIKGDILITDPCYWMKDEDYEKYCIECDSVSLLNPIENMQGMFAPTLVGDWSCSVFKIDIPMSSEALINIVQDSLKYGKELPGRVVGKFTADSGLVSVSEYNEIWDYNKNKAEELVDKIPWTNTILNDFDGDIVFTEFYRGNDIEPLRCIVGTGNYNFYTIQTGW